VDFVIGSVIRRRRREKCLTQLELSKRLHIDQTHISKIEGDQAMPSLDLLVQLIRELDISGLEVLDALGIPLSTRVENDQTVSAPKQSLEQIIIRISALEQELAAQLQALQRDTGELAALREATVLLRKALEQRDDKK